jgi:hypothetical protein
MSSILAWHFTGDTLRDGSPIPPVGEWLRYEGKVVMCESGLHASVDPFDALHYAPGPILHRVECRDVVETQSDKIVCRERRIISSMDATEMLRYFARMQALSVVHLWDAPDVVLDYLMTRDGAIRAAARDAARAAAWAAAGDAAWAAARAAGAAWAAARDAAQDATWAAGAAGDAAWAAARDAAWAARDAAQATWAARAAGAAWDAAQATWDAAQATWDAGDAARATWAAARDEFQSLVHECFGEPT